MSEELEQRVARLEKALADQQTRALDLMTSMLKGFMTTHEDTTSREDRLGGLEDRVAALEKIHPGSVVGTLGGPSPG